MKIDKNRKARDNITTFNLKKMTLKIWTTFKNETQLTKIK